MRTMPEAVMGRSIRRRGSTGTLVFAYSPERDSSSFLIYTSSPILCDHAGHKLPQLA